MKRLIYLVSIFAVFVTALALLPQFGMVYAEPASLTFAVIGDYGTDNAAELSVANMIKSWNPGIIITTGDDYYSSAGGAGSARYDESTGAYFCDYLRDITTKGKRCPLGLATINKFFPSLGNHDYSNTGASNSLPTVYTSYFTLPGAGYTGSSKNERYYDYVTGPVHFFVINSNQNTGQEPDGVTSTSIQARWLQTQLAASTSIWNIVYFHHPPYTSGIQHGSSAYMQWPFAQWGADAVFSGHEHLYERILRDGIVYFVNGTGGAGLYSFGTPIPGSTLRYNANYGAQKVIATGSSLTFEFYSIDNGGTLQDTYTLFADSSTNTPTPLATPTSTTTATPLPIVVLDFVTAVCNSSTVWESPVGTPSSCNGQTSVNGYMLLPTSIQVEDGSMQTNALVIAPPNLPGNIGNMEVRGRYDPIIVVAGDYFQAQVGCPYGATGCNVTLFLQYDDGSGIVNSLMAIPMLNDGVAPIINVDLSPLAGKTVTFYLAAQNTFNISSNNKGIWIAPKIMRVAPNP